MITFRFARPPNLAASFTREYDALFLRRDNADPIVPLPWRTCALLIAPRAFN